MTLHGDAATGILTQAILNEYIRDVDLNEPSNEPGNGTIGLTPLAVAARNGHVEVVRLLLNNNADVDALSSQSRTPLWIVTSRGRGDSRVEIVDLLLKRHANPKYCHQDLHGESTPLENELKQRKDPEVIRLLVDADGTTDRAKAVADTLRDPEISDAMQSTKNRSQFRDAVVGLISALILFILAWANSAALTGVANKVFKKFQVGGDKESVMAKKIQTEVGEPKTKEEFKQSISTFVQQHKLDYFFPDDDSRLLESLTSKAVDLQNDDSSILGQSANTEDLVKFALYQPIIYCDDSGSMAPSERHNEDRMADQRDLVRRIASICTKVVPDDMGVHLRFTNTKLSNANNLRMDDVERMMGQVKPDGLTEIGTNLRQQILDRFVYQTMTRPLFVSIITDGVPYGKASSPERRNTLQNEIIQCQEFLKANGLPSRSVIFQISQIGSDPESKAFLDGLRSDARLENVYVTAQQLDSKFRELRGNERDLEAWLFKTLLTPVLDEE